MRDLESEYGQSDLSGEAVPPIDSPVFVVLGIPLVSSMTTRVFGVFDSESAAEKSRSSLSMNREDIYLFTVAQSKLN